eukprot:COSAG04_NODE_21520_length_372_cov_0.761905_1_plen_54_part_01
MIRGSCVGSGLGAAGAYLLEGGGTGGHDLLARRGGAREGYLSDLGVLHLWHWQA